MIGPHLWQIRAVRDVFWLLLAGFALWGIYQLWDVFLPILVALLFAYLVNPILHWTEAHWGWSRSLTAGVLLIFAGLIIFWGVVGFVPLISQQIDALSQRLPEYLAAIAKNSGIEVNLLLRRMTQWTRQIEDPQALIEQIIQRATQTFSVVTRILSRTASWALILFLIPIYFYFFSRGFDDGVKTCRELIPLSYRSTVLGILGKMDLVVSSFFRGRLLVAFIMIAMFAVGWWAAGVPYWFLLSILAGLLSIIPYASGLFWPLAVLLKYVDTATSGGQISFLAIIVWPSLVFLVVQFLEGWFITPWIQSGQLNMSVPTVLIVVFIGGAIGGLLGLLLAIPIAACLKIFFEDLVLPSLQNWARKKDEHRLEA